MSYGQVTIDGVKYIERVQVFPMEVSVTVNGQIQTPRMVLPGVANFRLKGLTRTTINSTTHAVTAFPFKFRIGNSDGSIFYVNGGVGATLGAASPVGGSTDRVLDSLIFGNGQFPWPVPVPIFYGASSSIVCEFEDVTNAATATPYTIYLGFHGAYLIPSSSS